MKLSKTITLALMLACVLGATPLFAQLYGPWAGNGSGSCNTPTGITIYPWQKWDGFVRLDNPFSGNWEDTTTGNVGTFEGKLIIASPETALSKGTWTWLNPDGIFVEMGTFEMTFYTNIGICNGKWWPRAVSPPFEGLMWGTWIGE